MKHTLRNAAILAAAGVATVGMAAPAVAAGSTTYKATLSPLNKSTGSGTLTIELNGDQAVITEHVSGVAATFNGNPYPHVQHIHIDGQGMCPAPDADKDGDEVVNTTEGQPAYGPIGTSLTLSGDTSPAAGTALTVAPSGAEFDYSRTITLDAATLASVTAGKGVIVVHGLDPATLSPKAQAAKSDLVPTLPLAATSPTLCGALVASQVSQTPSGGASTGGGATSGLQDSELLLVGGGLVLAGGVALISRRRRHATIS